MDRSSVSAHSVWREIPPTTKDRWIAEFRAIGSPLLAFTDAMYAAAGTYSAVVLAFLYREQLHWTYTESPIPHAFNNPLSLAKPQGGEGTDRWMRFATLADCVREWTTRLNDPAYKPGNVGVYTNDITLGQLVDDYAPPSENDTGKYLDDVIDRINAMPVQEGTPIVPAATYPSYPVLWSEETRETVMVASPVPIVQKIIPASHAAQRPGTKRRNPWKWVQHETGNPSAGANAEMHYQFIMGLTTQNISFHFVVDDHQIIQLIPCDEVTWQAADGAGPGNYNGISCELCINSDGNKALSRRNAEWLAGGVLKADEGTVADVTRHWDYNQADPDRHYCPQLMMEEGYWPTFVANVGSIIAGKTPAPPPTYVAPIVLDLGDWDGRDRVLDDGTVMRACNRIIRARRTTKRYQVAADDAASIGADLQKGDEAEIQYVFQAKKGGTRWAYTKYGTRLKLSHFDPYIVISPKE